MLAREETPDAGQILLHGVDVGRANVTAAYQAGMSKSYQINQLFPELTVRANLRIGALGRERGRLRLDIFRAIDGFPHVEAVVDALLEELDLTATPTPSSARWPMARSAGSSSAWP